jgi:hypothetical protein
MIHEPGCRRKPDRFIVGRVDAAVYLTFVIADALYNADFMRGFYGAVVRRAGLGDDGAGRGDHKVAIGGAFDGRAIQDDRIEIRADTDALRGCAGSGLGFV